MDCFALALKRAASMQESGVLERLVRLSVDAGLAM